MNRFARLDQQYIWHPFTQMRDWLRQEPVVIESGDGALLRDVAGREYLDANSSIWTNLHGHNHPVLNQAIIEQLGRIAHSSALGLASVPASLLAAKLVRAANLQANLSGPKLSKAFFSDDGSTAMEVALKLAYEFSRRVRQVERPRFLSLAGAYHGDTVGAVSLGHIKLFHQAYSGLLFKTDTVMAPYCYRCPYNRAGPERADARTYRKCQWECIGELEKKMAVRKKRGGSYQAMVVEPLIQGAAGMIPQPEGWLKRAAALAREHQTLLIADEVMTGFGRTGPLFASHGELVQPDLLALAKGLTGGYLPMAATLTTSEVFDAFLGEYSEFKTFFHGHSYTANQLGSAVSLASLDLLESPESVQQRARLATQLGTALSSLWSSPLVGDIRQAGLVAGIELVQNWRSRQPFDLRQQAGIRVCQSMMRHGVLTRAIGNVIVIMPPYCTTPDQVSRMIEALGQAIRETFGGESNAS